MEKRPTFTAKQKRRYQELLDKTAEAAQKGEELSEEEEDELFELAALATLHIYGTDGI
jgi:hypothetical protein